MSVRAQDRNSTQPMRAGTAYSSRVRSGVDAAPEAGDNCGLASIRGALTLLLPNVHAGLVAPASCTVVGELITACAGEAANYPCGGAFPEPLKNPRCVLSQPAEA
jgi:hypothetical protein